MLDADGTVVDDLVSAQHKRVRLQPADVDEESASGCDRRCDGVHTGRVGYGVVVAVRVSPQKDFRLNTNVHNKNIKKMSAHCRSGIISWRTF